MSATHTGTAQLDYTEAELLATHDITEPLIAGGVRCHGGFDETGAYVSPRTKNRWPAIEAWAHEISSRCGYSARFVAVGDKDPEVGAPTQMAVFTR